MKIKYKFKNTFNEIIDKLILSEEVICIRASSEESWDRFVKLLDENKLFNEVYLSSDMWKRNHIDFSTEYNKKRGFPSRKIEDVQLTFGYPTTDIEEQGVKDYNLWEYEGTIAFEGYKISKTFFTDDILKK